MPDLVVYVVPVELEGQVSPSSTTGGRPAAPGSRKSPPLKEKPLIVNGFPSGFAPSGSLVGSGPDHRQLAAVTLFSA